MLNYKRTRAERRQVMDRDVGEVLKRKTRRVFSLESNLGEVWSSWRQLQACRCLPLLGGVHGTPAGLWRSVRMPRLIATRPAGSALSCPDRNLTKRTVVWWCNMDLFDRGQDKKVER